MNTARAVAKAFASNGLLRPYLGAYMRSSRIRGDNTDSLLQTRAALFTGVLTECYLRPRQSREDRTLGLEDSAGLSSFNIVESGYTPRRRGGKVRSPGRVDEAETNPRQPESELGAGREGKDWVVLVAEDEDGRELRTTAPFEEQYADVCSGMACEAIVFSADDFDTIYSTSELFVPEALVWVGPYPYLDHSEFRRFLGARKGRKKQRGKGVRSK